jgi:hypothetical protein
MRLGRRSSRLLSVLVPVSVVAGLLVPATAARATAYPSVTIVTPIQGATVSGLTSVKVHALTDPQGTDLVGDMTLYVDGKVGGGVNNCFPRVDDCTLFFLFDWSGYTGNHTEQIKETTENGVTLSSQVVTVKAVSAPPSASIVTPSDGDTVTPGEISVQTLGVIDASQDEDFPTSMALLVDDVSVQFSYCGAGFGSTCDVTLDWDASSAALGSHTLRAKFTTSLGKVATSPLVHVTLVAAPVLAAPTVHIDSPANGTTVTGLHSAHVTATTDPDGDDYPASTKLYLDGRLDSTASCAGTASTCTMFHLYDVSGLTGTHTLQATMTTEDGVTVSSQVVPVTAVSPPPTVVLTSPVVGSTVSGLHVAVDATGTIDPQQTFDFPTTMTLLVDGRTADSKACGTASETTCSAGLDWNTALASTGLHSLQVSLTTSHGNVGTSPALAVTLGPVQSQPQPAAIALLPSPVFLRGATGRVAGKVTLVANGSALSGVPISVTFSPPTGPAVTVSANADATGHFVAVDPARLTGNTTALAALGPDFGSASATRALRVAISIRCSVPAKASHGQPMSVLCRVPGLAYDSVVALHYAGRSRHGVIYAKVRRGSVSFRLTVAAKGQRLALWATTATTHTFTASRSRSYLLHIV